MKLGLTHRPPSSPFLGLPYRILNINHKKELLRGLWVETLIYGVGVKDAKVHDFHLIKVFGCFEVSLGLSA